MPIGPPGAPASVEVASGNRLLFVSWPAPNSNGSTVTGFKLRYCDTSGSCDTATGTDWVTRSGISAATRSYTISSLTNTAQYNVQLLTISRSKGESAWSTVGTATAGGPNAPATPRLTAGSGQISVTWNVPSPGHTAITSYDVQYRPCTETNSDTSVLTCASNPTWGAWTNSGVSITGTTATIASLTAGTNHEVRVRANNGQGAGRWSTTARSTPN